MLACTLVLNHDPFPVVFLGILYIILTFVLDTFCRIYVIIRFSFDSFVRIRFPYTNLNRFCTLKGLPIPVSLPPLQKKKKKRMIEIKYHSAEN